MRGAVVGVDGDWSEIALRWAFPAWSHITSPCFRCHQTLRQIKTDFDWKSWRNKAAEEYDSYCREAEKWVVIPDKASHRTIRFALEDHKKKKGRVRTRRIDLVGTSLLKGDRLEPSSSLVDTSDFDALSTFPTLVLFWRAPEGKPPFMS